MSYIGKNIRKLLYEKEISASELERVAGLKSGAVRNIISNKSKNPTIGTVKLISNALSCKIDDIVNYDEQNITFGNVDSTAEWNYKFFMDCTKYINEQLKSQAININFEDVLKVIREAYNAAYEENNPKVPRKLIEWLVGKIQQKQLLKK